MYRKIFLISALPLLIGFNGCATVGKSSTSTVKKDDIYKKIEIGEVNYLIPKSNDIVSFKGSIKDLNLPFYSRFIEKGLYERLTIEDVRNDSFIVHRRTDNGIAGSGVRYKVNYKINNNEDSYAIHLKPTAYTTYQQGLVGKFAVPLYGDNDLLNTLKDGRINRKFIYQSPYNTSSIISNFNRLLRKNHSKRHSIPVDEIGKYSSYIMNLKEKEIKLLVEAIPYRNGSKVIVYANIPAIETGKNRIDYSVISKIVDTKIKEVVED